jgi:Tol biopolymer transport system component
MIYRCGRMVGVVCVAVAIIALAREANAQFVQISVATDGTPGNAASQGAVFSGSAQVLAFSSLATNLVAGDTNGSRDVFVRDLAAHTTTRVSVASAGVEKPGDGGKHGVAALFNNDGVSLNKDGTLVAFASLAALVDADTNGNSDIYVHNRNTGQTERISVASDGAQGIGGDSVGPQISADGRYVVFTSTATNNCLPTAGPTCGCEPTSTSFPTRTGSAPSSPATVCRSSSSGRCTGTPTARPGRLEPTRWRRSCSNAITQ